MAKITAHEQPVLKIFSDDYAFFIPSYQRPYRWGTEQAEMLLSDLLTAAKEAAPLMIKGGKAGEAISPYFLGSIVVIQPQGPDVDVVDGQQRLTTLTLLMAAIRALLPDNEKANLNGRLLEKGNKFAGTQDRCRLTLRDRDQDFFKTYILEDESFAKLTNLSLDSLKEESRANIARNAVVLFRELEKLDSVSRDTLTAFLLQHTYLVVVATESLDSAFRIFSVLNDRGLDLTTADILKADLIGKVAKDREDHFTKKWEDLDERLGERDFDKLISHVVMIYHRQKMRESVLKTFRSIVNAESRSAAFIDKELVPYADAFETIQKAQWDGDMAVAINKTLKWLDRLDDQDWVPPALMLMVKHQGDARRLHLTLERLEKLAVVLWLNRATVNDRIERYGKVMNEIEKEAELASTSSLLATGAECAEARAVLDGDIYHITPKHKRTMILLRLDECLGSGEAIYEHDKVTVEHVLPQNPPPDSQWLKWWPDEKVRLTITHRLGNLALLNRRQNTAAKNWEFPVKKAKYFSSNGKASPFLITTGVLQNDEWTQAVFEKRQKEFLVLLSKAWSLEI